MPFSMHPTSAVTCVSTTPSDNVVIFVYNRKSHWRGPRCSAFLHWRSSHSGSPLASWASRFTSQETGSLCRALSRRSGHNTRPKRKYGLDDEASKAFGQWQFEPGKKDGAPVAVRIHVEL